MAVSREANTDRHTCFATAVRKASRRLTKLYDDALAPSGLRSTQFSILAELATRPDPPPTLTELAEALVSDRSSLGHALRPLVRDGYVALRRGQTDRRAQHIVLTERGRDKFSEGATHWQTAQEAFVSLYGEAWAKTLRTTTLEIAHDDRLGKMVGDAGTAPTGIWAESGVQPPVNET
jgi:DNA-binding MarR family transcriptional regulator